MVMGGEEGGVVGTSQVLERDREDVSSVHETGGVHSIAGVFQETLLKRVLSELLYQTVAAHPIETLSPGVVVHEGGPNVVGAYSRAFGTHVELVTRLVLKV